MAEEKLLTIREVSMFLGISEKEVIDLAELGTIPAYKVGGVYLRFKKDQIEAYRYKNKAALHKAFAAQKDSPGDWINDFLYFNDFYILSAILVLILLFIIFRGY